MGSSLDLPKTFKAWVFRKPGADLVLEERPLKAPDTNEVLVKVEACGVCHSDSEVGAGAFGDWMFPRTPGHEVIGNVAALGTSVTKFKIGDRVGTGWNGGFDGTCLACEKGVPQSCENLVINGIMRDGGYAEYMLVRTEALSRIPLDIPAELYTPMLCAGVTVYNGMRQVTTVSPGSLVAINGMGGLGHLAVQFAAKMGHKVVVISRGDKEEFSRKLGATHYINKEKENAVERMKELGKVAMLVGCGPDAAAECDLLAGMAPRGEIIIFCPFGDFRPDPYTLAANCLVIRGWSCGVAIDCEETLQLAREQEIKCMVTPFKFEQAQEALDHMKSGKARFRSVIVM